MNYKKNIFWFLFSIAVSAFCFLGCQEDEINKPPTAANQGPPSFDVTVGEVGQNFAIISWNAVTDPEGDPLYRSISLEGTIVVKDLTDDNPFKLENLQPSKTYSGTVSITDKKAEPVVVPFTFKTKKYMTLFNKLISQYNDQSLVGFSICKTHDKGYAVGANFTNGNGYGLFVLKFDSLGNEEWHTEIEANDNMTTEGTIIQTNDNGYAIAERSTLTKLNSNGQLEWQKIGPWGQAYNSIIETDDLGFLVVGTRGDVFRGSIAKFDKNGAQEWEKLFDGDDSEMMSSCSQIVRTSGDDYMIAGTQYTLATARIDNHGTIKWLKTYEHPIQTYYAGVKIKSVGSDFILGSQNLEENGTEHARIMKIDQYGNAIWDQTFQWGGFETDCRSICSLEDGSTLFVGGYTNSQHYKTAIIVKINPNGELIWKKDFKPSYIDYVWELRGVEQTSGRGLIFMGNKGWIWSGNEKESGLWLLKTDENVDF